MGNGISPEDRPQAELGGVEHVGGGFS